MTARNVESKDINGQWIAAMAVYNSHSFNLQEQGMQWIAPPEKDAATDTLEKRLWAAADQLRANSGLTSAQYGQPVLGLIFLRFAEVRFAAQRAKLEKTAASSRRGSRVDVPARIPRGWRPVTSRPPPDSTISATCPKVRMPGKSSTKRWRISRNTIRNWLAS